MCSGWEEIEIQDELRWGRVFFFIQVTKEFIIELFMGNCGDNLPAEK